MGMPGILKNWVMLLVGVVVTPPALVFLAVICALLRRSTTKRQKRHERPRLVYGPVPIISIKYMSQAMERLGYKAKTFVYTYYKINKRCDFDYYIGDFFKGILRNLLNGIVGRYCVFSWLVLQFDIFHYFFDGGFLSGTPLRFFEVQLLHLAGKKVIAMPYGSDVAICSRIHSLVYRQNLLADYPSLGQHEVRVIRQVNYFSKHADFIVGVGHCIETMPRWTLLASHYYPIDTDSWSPSDYRSDADGKSGEVTVVHSPNHNWLKGTAHIIAACNALQKEGYPVKLRLLEGVPNTEVHRILQESDILAEQFGMPWYGVNAMEGMSLGKPVLSDLSDGYYTEPFIRYTGFDECPIVNTPLKEIKEKLRVLIENPELRRELGETGRKYVLKYHSYSAVGRMWNLIYRRVWDCEDIDLAVWHPE